MRRTEKNLENIGKSYDVIAKDFAAMRTEFYREKKYLDYLIQLISPKSHILDVGCGSGIPIAAYFLKQGFKVTGIDASKKLLAIARKNHPTMKCIYGDVRTISLKEKYDAIVEWWCLFHIPKIDHDKIIARFATWLNPKGLLEFTTGDHEYEAENSDMLNQELPFYSHHPDVYEKCLKQHGFKLLLKESDQEQHLVWVAQKT